MAVDRNKDQVIYHDSAIGIDGKIRNDSIAGLGVRMTAQGAKSFIHTYRFNGKERRKVIGSPANMNVASARLLVTQRKSEIERGINPDRAPDMDHKKKHAVCLEEVIDEYYQERLSKRSAAHKREFSRLIAPWTMDERKQPNKGRKRNNRKLIGEIYRDSPMEDITPRAVGRYLNKIQSASTANSILQQLKALFNWAIRMQIVDMRNPCDPIEKRKIIKKRRDYTPEQVKAIAWHIFNPPMRRVVSLDGLEGAAKRKAALDAGHATREHDQLMECCHFMGILFLTMARPAEVKRARFEHFDLDHLIWHKHNTKGIQLSQATYEYAFRSVPIHPKVAELVLAQRARWPESDLLFPNHADQTQPRDNFKRGLSRFKQFEGVPDYFQLYDLKRMAISLMMVGQGVHREDVSHYVDHKGNLETTLIYDLGFVDPLRPVTDRLGELLGLSKE